MARFRTIQARLKGRYHYPQVSLFAFDKRMVLENLPGNFNGRGLGTVTFRYSDPIDVIAGMLKDKSLHGELEENLIWGAETVYNTTGHRVFTRDLSSGTWWSETQDLVGPDVTIVPILWYADKTFLTHSGSQQAHPIMLTIGNLRWWIRQSVGGWKTVAAIPILQAAKPVKKVSEFKEFEMWLYQKCWSKLISAIRQCYDDGGFELEVAGVTRRFLPVVAFCCQDSPEVRICIVIYGNIRKYIYAQFGYIIFPYILK